MPTDLLTILHTWGRMLASELQLRMGVSRATMMLAVRAQAERVIVRGNAMLPMKYAPVRGVELPEREFAPQLPLPDESAIWTEAARAAIVFWDTSAAERRISAAFRAICKQNAKLLRTMA